MPFNPFVWNNTEPDPNQLISNGQVTILNNFNFLGDATGLGVADSTPGYVELPNGLILQWGKTSGLPNTSGGDAVFTLTFAGPNTGQYNSTVGCGMQSFPNNCFAVWLQPLSTNVGTGSGTQKLPIVIDDSSITNTDFTCYVGKGSGYTKGAYVFALGN